MFVEEALEFAEGVGGGVFEVDGDVHDFGDFAELFGADDFFGDGAQAAVFAFEFDDDEGGGVVDEFVLDAVVGAAERDEFGLAAFVGEDEAGHHAAGFGGFLDDAFDHAREDGFDAFAGGDVLRLEPRVEVGDAAAGGFAQAFVLFEGVAGNIEAQGFFLDAEAFQVGVGGDASLESGFGGDFLRAEQGVHAAVGECGGALRPGHGFLEALEELAAVAELVEGAALDEAFHGFAVADLVAQAGAEVREALEGPGAFAFLEDLQHGALAEALDGVQAEEDVLPDDREVGCGLVDVGGEDVDVHLAGVADVLGDLVAVLAFDGQQGGHELHGVVRLEPRGLVRDDAVRRGVALVEAVVRERVEQVEQFVPLVLGDAVAACALDEDLPLAFHLLGVLLTHRAAQ